ncbi:MAG: ATP-dependent Clp protease ATP-binding subunit [bacterium]
MNIVFKWFFWRFIEVPKAIVLGWANFLKFNLVYFSIGALIKSLLSPWRADKGDYGRGFDAKRYFETFLGNMISRVLGAIIRLALIVVGLAMQICIFFAGFFALIIWVFLPAVVMAGFLGAIGSEASWAKYLALLCLIITLWEIKKFFGKGFKNSKLRYSLKQGLQSPGDFVFKGFLDYQANKIFKKAKSKDALLILLAKSKSRDIVFVFGRAGLSQKKLQKFCSQELLLIKEETEVNLEKIIIEAAKLAAASALGGATACRGRITPGDLLCAFASLDPVMGKFLVENDFKKEDIKNLVDWFYKEKYRKEKLACWWDYTNLLTRGSVGSDFSAGYTITLDRFSFDWRNKIGKNVFREIIGHENEIKQIERILEREQNKNVLLVGEPGTGRGSIIEAMAQRAFLGISAPSVNRKRILQFDISALTAQAQSQEEAEMLLEKCFVEAVKAKNVILAINDFHNYVSLVSQPGMINISGIMARFLGLPSFQIIAVTTYDGFHTHIEANSSFSNLFEKVGVAEISEQETLVLMEQFVPFFEAKHKKYISFRALKEILKVSSRYMAQSPFPEKALRLLDESMVYLKMYAKDSVLMPKHIRKIVSEKTKIPLEALESKEKQILLNLENLIHNRLINQVEAVSEVASALRRARSEVNLKSGPIGAFLFLGPTGVGKTETAKALAEIYFGNEQNMIRFDMSEFQAIDAIKDFLTTKIKEKPFSLLLLDELEKAHLSVLNLFLQVLDEGHLTDSFGRRVDFKNTIIIATSNVASEIIMEDVKQGNALDKIKEHVFNHIFSNRLLKPEFINRFDAVVLFKPLGKLELLQIAGLMLNKLSKNLLDKGIKFEATGELKEKIVELSYNPAFGAREMKRAMQDNVENSLAKALLLGELKRGKSVSVNPVDFSLSIR